jgi:transposase-like protein
MEQLTIRLKTGIPHPHYSESFKRQIVREYEQGLLNKNQLQKKYGIGGKSRLLDWCRKYGKLAYSKPSVIGRPMKDPQKQRIKELEAKLKAAELKLKVYDKLIEVTNRELDTDIIKKIEARLSENWQQKKR